MIDRQEVMAKARASATIDAIPRASDEEERINSVCRAALNGPGGQDLMDYLISITLMAVMPPGSSEAELREKEGQRRLVGILDARRKSTPNQGEHHNG